MSMKVLVTGGAGFIGSHLVDRLLEDGADVTVIDNYATGRPQNLSHLAGHPRLRVVAADINDQRRIAPYFEGIERVFHLAAIADIVPSMERPSDYHHANVTGTLSVLELSRKAGVKRFLYAASSSCYGIPDVYPTPESAPTRPMYPYAVTKLLGEHYALSWNRIYGLPVVSMRFFNVYGPRSRTSGTYGAVFGVFLAQKLNKAPYTVVGDGTQSRDFTFVTDVVDAVVTAANSQIQGEVFNVGSGGHVSVNRLLELLEGPKVFIPKRPGEPDVTFADIRKISSVLKWSPKVSFEAGVAEMLKHIDYWREAPVWNPESIKKATDTWFRYLGKGDEKNVNH